MVWTSKRREYADSEGFAVVDERGVTVCERTWQLGKVPRGAAERFERIAALPALGDLLIEALELAIPDRMPDGEDGLPEQCRVWRGKVALALGLEGVSCSQPTRGALP